MSEMKNILDRINSKLDITGKKKINELEDK